VVKLREKINPWKSWSCWHKETFALQNIAGQDKCIASIV